MKDSGFPQPGLRKRPDRSDALDRAYRILALRDHTRQELAVKLRQKGFDRAAVDGALQRCLELGYLNDARTAMTLARHLAESGYGPLRIRHALGQKGVADATINMALAACGDEKTQLASARRMLEKKAVQLAREADPWRRRQKAYRFLAGRGFPLAVIKQAVAEFAA
ncbi:MAG: regulatory protein RecX [Desulfosarcina sp.]